MEFLCVSNSLFLHRVAIYLWRKLKRRENIHRIVFKDLIKNTNAELTYFRDLFSITSTEYRRLRNIYLPHNIQGKPYHGGHFQKSINKKIHVFTDTESTAVPILTNPDFSQCEFEFYSTSNLVIPDHFSRDKKIRINSIRELFPEISDEAEELRQVSRDASQSIIASLSKFLISKSSFLEEYKDALELALEDDINHEHTIASCYLAAASNLPKDAVLIVAFSDEDFFPSFFENLQNSFDSQNIFTLFSGSSEETYRRAQTSLHKKIPGESSEHNELHFLKKIIEGEVNWKKLGHKIGTQINAPCLNNHPEKQAITVVFDPVSSPYINAIDRFAREAVKSGKSINLIFLQNIKNNPSVTQALSNQATNQLVYFLDQNHPDLDIEPTELQSLLLVLEPTISNVCDSTSLFKRLLSSTILKFFSSKYPRIVSLSTFAESTLASLNPEVIVTTAARSWRTRIYSTVARASRRTKIIDLQVINLLPQKKYVLPIADKLCVIDQASYNLHTQYLNAEPESVVITGSLLDRQSDEVPALERLSSLPSLPKKFILFASQLLPWERIENTLASIIEFSNAHSVPVVIKLHPRENKAREFAFEELVEKYHAGSVVIVPSQESIEALIPYALTCVTFYSNVGRQAAHLGIPVICSFIDGWIPPIRLDQEGYAKAAFTPQDLLSILDQYTSREHSELTPRDNNKPNSTSQKILNEYEKLSFNKRPLSQTHIKKIIIESCNDLDRLKNEFDHKLFDKVEIHSLSPISDTHNLGYPNASYRDCEYTEENEELFKSAIEIANHHSSEIATEFASRLADNGENQKFSEMVSSLTLLVRPEFIRSAKKVSVISRAASNSLPTDDVLVIGRSREFFQTVRNAYAELENSVERIIFWNLSENTKYTPALNDIACQSEICDRYLDEISDLPPLDSSIGERLANLPSEKTILVTTNWALKTVPSTLTPLLSLFGQDDYSVYLVNLIDTEQKTDLSKLLNQHFSSFKVLSPKDFQHTNPKSKNVRHSVDTIHDDFMSSSFKAETRKLLESNASIYTNFISFSERIFRNTQSVSLACPGRQWHTDLAHTLAQMFQKPAVTIQNAYMSNGYTYTQPTGNLITAIDHEQRDLFVNSYSVPPESILVCGSPRFDSISRNDFQSAPSQASILNGQILFGTQIGLEEIAIEATKAVLKAKASNIKKLVIKLHPRTPLERLEFLKREIEGLDKSDFISFETERDVRDLISHSDLVMTVYSNIGLEAVIMDKPVLFTAYTERYVDLSPTGMCPKVRSPLETQFFIENFYNDPQFRHKILSQGREFLNSNPDLRDGTSTKTIKREIDRLIS